jgi:hypothetical protein
MVPWYGKPIPYHTHTNTMSPYTIPCLLYHTMSLHAIYQSCHRVSGVLFENMEIISSGCNTGPLGTIFCGQVLQLFVDILSYKWRLDGKLHPVMMWPLRSKENKTFYVLTISSEPCMAPSISKAGNLAKLLSNCLVQNMHFN